MRAMLARLEVEVAGSTTANRQVGLANPLQVAPVHWSRGGWVSSRSTTLACPRPSTRRRRHLASAVSLRAAWEWLERVSRLPISVRRRAWVMPKVALLLLNVGLLLAEHFRWLAVIGQDRT